MVESIFTKIIKGEVPAYKVYEDDLTFAFLDIHPARPGHTLVVPKQQVDRLEDLAAVDYQALMNTVKKVMQRIVKVYGKEFRPCLKVEGFDVAHAHIHVIPCRSAQDFWTKQDPTQAVDHAALAAEAQKIAFS